MFPVLTKEKLKRQNIMLLSMVCSLCLSRQCLDMHSQVKGSNLLIHKFQRLSLGPLVI